MGYIAGIIDGEGTITLAKKAVNEHRSPIVSVTNTDRELLVFLKSRMGGEISKKKSVSPAHRDAFQWTVCGDSAIEIMRVVGPHLRTYKRIRSEMIVKNFKRVTPRNGKYTPMQLSEKMRFEADVLSVRQV